MRRCRNVPVPSSGAMSETRRARPTIRCLVEDLGVELPDLTAYLGGLDEPWIDELRRITPESPTGQKRILFVAHPLVYRLRLSSERGTTWLDEDGVGWLRAVRRRVEGSDDDAFRWFANLHKSGRLLPTDDDRLRDKAEEARLLFGYLKGDLIELVDGARLIQEWSARRTWAGGCQAGRSRSRRAGWRRSGAALACDRLTGTSFAPRPGTFYSLLWRTI